MSLLAAIFLLSVVTQNAHADWADWWRTPEQQASAAFENGDIDQLQGIAPNEAWEGVAAHESGDYENAAQLFNEVSQQQRLAGNQEAANQTLYNRGVSEVQAGQYEKAVETFDQVLEQNPEFDDAQHNRDIAQQLIQQQTQEQQQQGEGDDESEPGDQDGEPGEQSEPTDSGEQSSDEQSGEQDSGQESPDEPAEQDSTGSEGQQDDASDASQTESEASQRQAEQDARDALEAEARASEQTENNEEEDDGEPGTTQAEQPMTEGEQATEQWLRRIPDDPAGLLRRKLEQSHRTEYPEVRDASEPW